MSKFKLKKLSQITEIVAAIAVIVSLVYVGNEVQSNTAAIRGASMQAIATSDAETLMTVASDASLSEIIRRGHLDPSQLDEAENFRYFLFMRNFWLSFQNIYQQRELELIDRSVWQSYVTVICGMVSRPGPNRTWPEHVDILDAEFVKIVERCESRPL